MRELVEVLITGFTIGIVYFLVAVGFTLCYGVGRVLNYSYGSFFTWGAYLAWVLAVGYAELNYFLVFLIVLPITFLMGVAVDRVIIRPLRSRPEFDFSVLLATLGLAVFLDNLVLVIFGARTKSLPEFLEGSVTLAGFTISWQLLAMFIFAAVVAVILFVFMAKTRTGMSMRAVAQDPIGARIVGIPLFRVFAITFGISTMLSGAGGILLAPRFFMTPLGGWTFLVKALIIVIAGGLGSIKGTLYAGFLLGILEALVGWQLGLLWVMPVWFLVLFLVLLIRPAGLFGAVARKG
ncbi:MAG: branched-chain amino acid ABC transporter permease [Actinomycetia bacterium]|nr:branched-chain amino acid ABC transporter permease [Actinomycetes bacterium]